MEARKPYAGARRALAGQAVVETALILGFAVLLTLGVIEFGAMLDLKQTVVQAARVAARYAAGQGPLAAGTARDTVEATSLDLANRVMSGRTDDAYDADDLATTVEWINPNGAMSPTEVRATVSYTYTPTGAFLLDVLGAEVTLQHVAVYPLYSDD